MQPPLFPTIQRIQKNPTFVRWILQLYPSSMRRRLYQYTSIIPVRLRFDQMLLYGAAFVAVLVVADLCFDVVTVLVAVGASVVVIIPIDVAATEVPVVVLLFQLFLLDIFNEVHLRVQVKFSSPVFNKFV